MTLFDWPYDKILDQHRRKALRLVLSPLERVKEFHRTYGMPIKEEVGWPDDDRVALRDRLIDEEVKEAKEAVENGDIENYAKELADILYVVYGAAIEHGIPLDEVFAEVHRSNMSKLDENGKPIIRADGKILKGKKYREPDLKKILGL